MYPDRVVNYEYDRLDRITMRYFVNDGVPVYNSYQYYVRQNAPSESNVVYRTTQLLREIVDNTGYTYTYDDVGNILTVKTSQRLYPNTSNVEIGEHSDYRSYSYDNKYQLTRENNVTSGKTTVYSYDGLGNITSKTEYPYTQGALGTALSTVNYTYSNDGKNGWNKLLTAVGNETVTYDAIGNPTSYLGASLSWFGRKLQSYEKGNTNVTYTYDAGGSRASKTVNGTKSEFVYLDGKLVYEKRGGDDIFYLYDSYGSLSNIRWYKNGASSPTNIYVITNRQGDVLGLYDYAGTRKVSYEYDAWGNTVSVTDTSQDNWSTLNPFRYRGYYFDSETGLYYVLSRYYNPEVGRFLNADGFVSTGQGVLGNNMFAYCGNNPVNRVDPSGELAISATAFTIATLGMLFLGVVTIWVLASAIVMAQYPATLPSISLPEIKSKPKAAEKEVAIPSPKPSPRDPVHHIVAKADPRAAEARQILRDVGLEPLTESKNLVVLPRKYHASLHTNAYYRYINDRLRPVAGDRVAVEMTLDSLRNEILERSLLGIRWD